MNEFTRRIEPFAAGATALAGRGLKLNVRPHQTRSTSFLPPSSAISKGSTLKTVTLDVRPPADAMADFAQAWKTGKGSKSDRISFATPELLWKVLTAKRWELLKALCGAGPVTVREAARRVSRDVNLNP